MSGHICLRMSIVPLTLGMMWQVAKSAPPEGTLHGLPTSVAVDASVASDFFLPSRSPLESQFGSPAPTLANIVRAAPHSANGTSDFQHCLAPDGAPWELQLLPDGLLYGSYLAGPREPRFGYEWLYDTQREVWVNEVALGGRMGLLRFGDFDAQSPEGWQLDMEGAAFPQLAEGSLDLLAADFRFGIPLTWRRGSYQVKLAYYHLSSHAGDEFLLTAPSDFTRINFSRNAFVLGAGYFPLPDLRLYGEVGYGFINDGGNEPWEFQFGAENRPSSPTGLRGAPFWALNAHLREEVDFGGSFTAEAGWAWRGPDSGHLLRVGAQYYSGHTRQYEFLGRTEDLIGLGIWFDH